MIAATRRRGRAMVAILAIAGIAHAACGCSRRVSPEARLAKALAADDAAVAEAAMLEVGGLDPAGQRAVVLRLARETAKFPFGLANAPGALRRIEAISVPLLLELREDPATAAQADGALQHMGPAAAAAVPALQRTIAEGPRERRVWAGAALAWIAPERVPAEVARAADADPEVAVALGVQLRGAPGGAAAVPGLAALLEDPRPRVREYAAAALAELGGRSIAAGPGLASLANDPDPRVRRQAERALAAAGQSSVVP